MATTLTVREVDDDTALRLSRGAFVAGGPVHGVGFAALTAALVLAGSAALPRWVVVTGLASAVSGAASPLYFLWTPAGWLIPGGRFPGLVVAAVAGPLLSSPARHRLSRDRGERPHGPDATHLHPQRRPRRTP